MQGAVGCFYMHLTANLPRNLPVNFFLNRLRFDRIMVMSLWNYICFPVFGPPCICISFYLYVFHPHCIKGLRVQLRFLPARLACCVLLYWTIGPMDLLTYSRHITIVYTGWAKKRGHRLMTTMCKFLTD